MADRDNQIITYVTDAEKQQLKEWAEQTGKSQSELAREAILEYTDHDRSRRIEEKVDRILDTLHSADGGQHTHTNPRSKSVPEKARAVADHIYQHHDSDNDDGVIKTTDVELAIENIADVGDDRSVEKYKRQLRKRGLLFEHPAEKIEVWTQNKGEWVKWVDDFAVGDRYLNGIEQYPIDGDEFDDLLAEVTG